MSAQGLFLAIYKGSKDNPRMKAWNAMSEAERGAKMQQGVAAWKAWVEKHKDAIVEMGGPLGKTKAIDAQGVTDISNNLTGFTVIRAASQDEAAKMFEKHPHFTIFPGENVEVMPVLAIPAG